MTAARAARRSETTSNDGPCDDSPTGRGVLLGPPLADLGAADTAAAEPPLRRSRHAAASYRAPGAGTRSTFEGSPV